MPGSNNFSTYDGVFSESNLGGFVPLKALEPTDDTATRNDSGQGRDNSTGWVSPSLIYQNARNQGYGRRASRLIAGKDLFLQGLKNDNPDFDYVRKSLRNLGLSRRGARRAMENPEFWANLRKAYGVGQKAAPAPLDLKEVALRDKMDREALAHEQAGDTYNPATGTWTPKQVAAPTVQTQAEEIALDDLRGISSFNEAFRTARQRGLKLFQWGNKGMIYGTLLAKSAPSKEAPKQPTEKVPESIARPTEENPETLLTSPFKQLTFTPSSATTEKKQPKPMLESLKQSSTPNSVLATTARYLANNTVTGDFGIGRGIKNGVVSFVNWLNEGAKNNPNNRNRAINPHGYYLLGGKLDNTQKEFVAYLIQLSGALTQLELNDFIQSLGEDGLRQEYQNFINSMLQGTTSAKNGAKLNYIKSLRGKCPEGFELGFFKEGGLICAKCVEKKEKQGAIPFKPLQGEKGTKVVQDFKKELKNKKDKIFIESKKKADKKELGGVINIKPEFLEAFKCGGKMKKENGGLVKKDKKIPIKEQFINKDKCGGKAKKKKKK